MTSYVDQPFDPRIAEKSVTASTRNDICEAPTKAVLLVGGLGTRLRSVVGATPKPLATVGNGSFLELLVQQLRNHDIRHLVMCTGYLADHIENKFGDGSDWDVTIEYSKEPQPLGTGGALRLARNHLEDVSDFLVMNGDSFLEMDFHELIQVHREHSGVASVAVLRVEDASRYGTVQVDSGGRVIAFMEKNGRNVPGLVNAGVYVFNRAVFEYLREGNVSLEQDVFPQLVGHGIFASEQHGVFIDIGTPADYERAQQMSDRLCEAALHINHRGTHKSKTP